MTVPFATGFFVIGCSSTLSDGLGVWSQGGGEPGGSHPVRLKQRTTNVCSGQQASAICGYLSPPRRLRRWWSRRWARDRGGEERPRRRGGLTSSGRRRLSPAAG